MKSAIVASACVLSACCVMSGCKPNAIGTRNGNAPLSVAEATGENDQRVASVTAQLRRNGTLPGAVLDAHFLEEKEGDGTLGPSDFRAFYALQIPPADVPLWRAALAKSPLLDKPAPYAAPKSVPSWWVTRQEFGKLEFTGPGSLTGRANGWVGFGADGRIFVYAFTM